MILLVELIEVGICNFYFLQLILALNLLLYLFLYKYIQKQINLHSTHFYLK